MATPDETPAGTGLSSLTWAAVGLALAAVGVMVVLAAMDHDGPGWLLQPVLGLAAAGVAWRAGGGSPRNPVAFLALVIGILMTAIFLGYVIADLY